MVDRFLPETYKKIIAQLPGHLKEEATTLPFRIGISKNPTGGWEDYLSLKFLYDLPYYIAQDYALNQPEIETIRLANLAGCLHCLCLDKLADNQAQSDSKMDTIIDGLKTVWIKNLRIVSNNDPSVNSLIDSALRKWKKGVCWEKRVLSQKKMISLPRYKYIIRLKSRWIAVASIWTLKWSKNIHVIAEFLKCFDFILYGLQYRDDALDHLEDRFIYGSSYPDILGQTPAALVGAARMLLLKAAKIAQINNFTSLSQEIEKCAFMDFQVPTTSDPLLNHFSSTLITLESGYD